MGSQTYQLLLKIFTGCLNLDWKKKMKALQWIKLLICISLFMFLAGTANADTHFISARNPGDGLCASASIENVSDANHLLVTAIQTLSQENDDLQVKIFKLEKRIAKLEKLLNVKDDKKSH